MDRLRSPLHRLAVVFVFTALAAGPPAASAQSPAGDAVEAARFAWDAGDYPAALEGFRAVLAGPDAARRLAEIALVTGERYRTVELAPDGRNVRWSADGRYAAWEAGDGAAARTYVAAVAADGAVRPAVAVEGRGLAFGPGGAAAVLRIDDTDAVRDARVRLDSALQARDYRAFYAGRARLARLEADNARLVVRDLAAGTERTVRVPFSLAAIAYGDDGTLYALTGLDDAGANAVHAVAPSGETRVVVPLSSEKRNPTPLPGGRHLLYDASPSSFAVVDLATGAVREIEGTAPAASADGARVAFLGTDDGGDNTLAVLDLGAPGADPAILLTTEGGLANPHPLPGGGVLAQHMPRDDWEVVVVPADGGAPQRVTRDVQHDLFPRPFGDGAALVVKGEGRHRRSYRYDLATGASERLFHNNTIRTVAPEYEWAVSPDGARMLVVSERDGDTISPERGVYLVDRTQPLSVDEVRARVETMLGEERALRAAGAARFEPVADAVRAVVADVSVDRIYAYEKDLFAFGSKHIAEPGNALAIDYLAETLRSFGYEPELQWFEPRPGLRTANVIATLPGTAHPDVHYVVSSHFDSVQRGPGADDNTSGTAALLEAARVLAGRPQSATIRFAFFTGEEAGLLGSREFVRRAVEDGDYLAGALNNDMVGYANDQRLDNTIRYSNAGLRDLQHAAAFLFTDLITYDAKYYKSTDAHAYYEAYGDIVAGIGSYPILANPHYHQATDVLETVNHQLVAEVSKTTVASLMLMASSPGRVRDVAATRAGDGLALTWTAAPERDVNVYTVTVERPGAAPETLRTDDPSLRIDRAPEGTVVRVWAENAAGLRSWDAVGVTTD